MLESSSIPAQPEPTPGHARPPLLGRRRLAVGLPLAVGAALLLAGGAFRLGGVRLGQVDLPTGRQAPVAAVAVSSPEVEVRFRGLPLAGLRVEVDGRPVPLRTRWLTGRADAVLAPLADGRHELSVTTGSHEQSWNFVVDTRPPSAVVASPRPGAALAARSVVLRGRTEPGARLVARNGEEEVAGQAGLDGAFALQVPLRHGVNRLRLEASDAAGNRTASTLEVGCDQTPPVVEILSPALVPGKQEVVVDSGSPTLRLKAADAETPLRSLQVRLDGGPPRDVPLPAAGKPVEVALQGLPDGRRTLEVLARNGAGATTRRRLEFVVDSTETLGQATLTLGARGRDVADLQKRLAAEGYLREADFSGRFGDPTKKAILALQEDLGLKADGIAGPFTIGALSSRIYVNLSRFSLVLVEWGGGQRTYTIAHGTPEFPTPTGSFHVADLARNPTWIPPDSPWAREAKSIPPGPGNPLGTRWIGLNNGVVGIHGTPAAWTIGSRASHGCIRMTVPDVEDLYEHVDPGARVRIFAGDEDDPVLRKLWP